MYSNAWYLLPILIGIVGGLIFYLVMKDDGNGTGAGEARLYFTGGTNEMLDMGKWSDGRQMNRPHYSTDPFVLRGEDGTSAAEHIEGSTVDLIDTADDALIEIGDDFGFTEYRYDFDDGRVFSPTKGTDL